jgi:hypothetical protein
LLQWQIDWQSIARSTLVALKGELKGFGNPPIYHLRDEARHFLTKGAEFLAGGINPIEAYEHIRQNAQSLGGNKRGMNLAQNVSRKYLSLFLEDSIPIDPFYPMTRSYIEDVYTSRYEAPVRREAEMPSDMVNYRLSQIRPIVNMGMDHYAKQLVRSINVNKLSIPRGLAPSKFKTNDDLDDYLNQSVRMS